MTMFLYHESGRQAQRFSKWEDISLESLHQCADDSRHVSATAVFRVVAF